MYIYTSQVQPLCRYFFIPYSVVVNHHGKFAQGGHYTADILQKDGSWIRFDDSDFQTVQEKVVLGKQSDRQPYMLFYRSLNPQV